MKTHLSTFTLNIHSLSVILQALSTILHHVLLICIELFHLFIINAKISNLQSFCNAFTVHQLHCTLKILHYRSITKMHMQIHHQNCSNSNGLLCNNFTAFKNFHPPLLQPLTAPPLFIFLSNRRTTLSY